MLRNVNTITGELLSSLDSLTMTGATGGSLMVPETDAFRRSPRR